MFTASASTLVIEIVAGRILAPDIGVSLYTWTSIIGIVLAGISIGNYLGGLAADRYPQQRTLGLILLAGGLSSLAVLPLVGVASNVFDGLSLVPRIVFLTVTLFFLPSLILGMVTPVVIKLRLRDLASTG
ncbi:MAG: fused MFS/spermidine synthase, partial [Acidimicrobiia bacterium]